MRLVALALAASIALGAGVAVRSKGAESGAVAPFALAGELSFSLRGQRVASVKLADLARELPAEEVSMVDPYYGKPKRFRGWPLGAVLARGFGTSLGEARTLELVLRDLREAGPRAPLPSVRDAGDAELSSLRVLLVEDNAINRKVASRMLRKLGIEAAVAENGREAVEASLAASYDVVLMDVQMPEMDGMEATRRIREAESQGRRKVRTPIVALTASTLEGDRQICIDAGMDDFLSKPLDPEALKAAINRYASGDRLARTA